MTQIIVHTLIRQQTWTWKKHWTQRSLWIIGTLHRYVWLQVCEILQDYEDQCSVRTITTTWCPAGRIMRMSHHARTVPETWHNMKKWQVQNVMSSGLQVPNFIQDYRNMTGLQKGCKDTMSWQDVMRTQCPDEMFKRTWCPHELIWDFPSSWRLTGRLKDMTFYR